MKRLLYIFVNLMKTFGRYGLCVWWGIMIPAYTVPQVISPALQDTIKILKYIELAERSGWNKPDSTFFYALQARELSEAMHYDKGKFLAYKAMSSVCYVTGEYGKGLQEARKALHLAYRNKNDHWLMSILNTIGLLHQQIGKDKESITYFKEALKIAIQKKDSGSMATFYNNMANSYLAMHEYKKSLQIRNKALLIRTQMKDELALADTYNDLGETYYQMNKMDSALYYLFQCLSIKQKYHDLEMCALASYNIGECYLQTDSLQLAKKYLQLALSYADSISSDNYRLMILSKQTELYEKENNIKEQVILLKKVLSLKDILYNKENQRQINLLQMQFKTEQKEMQIRALQKEKEQEKQKSLWIITFSVVGILLLSVFAIIIYKRFRITKQQKQVIEEQKKLVEEKNKDIMDSITYARRIQQAILPSPTRWRALLPHSFVLYLPKDIVAGDFYWLEESGEYMYVAAADCTGHGVPGAMVSVVCSNALTKAVLEEKIINTDDILNRVREIVIEKLTSEENIRDGMDVCLIRLTKGTNTLQYSGANRPLYVVEGNELKEFKPDKQPIGRYEGMRPFSKQEIVLQKNSMLYLCTDGYADQFGGKKGKKIGTKAFKELLKENAIIENPLQQREHLLFYFQSWKANEEQVDDVTVLGLRV